MGEDEGNAETHRKAQPKSGHRHHHHHHHHGRGRSPQRGGYGSPDRNDEESPESEEAMAWSWVGNRSPLMGSQEETEWILERLMDRLRESLSAEGRRQLRAETRALGAGHHRPVNGSHHNGHNHEDKEKEKGH
jgi:potassium channel subfamily K